VIRYFSTRNGKRDRYESQVRDREFLPFLERHVRNDGG
jgi:hypothetical protein